MEVDKVASRKILVSSASLCSTHYQTCKKARPRRSNHHNVALKGRLSLLYYYSRQLTARHCFANTREYDVVALGNLCVDVVVPFSQV